MSEEFKVIESQEQLDAIIGKRIRRAEDSARKEAEAKFEGYLSPEDVAKKYEGYVSPEDVATKYKDFASPEIIAQKDAQIRGLESSSLKMKVALETGLPWKMASKLTGDSEEDIRKDAEELMALIGASNKKAAPLASTEPYVEKDDKRDALKKTLSNMRGL